MSAEVENLCGLKREDFQTTVNGKQTDLFIVAYRPLSLSVRRNVYQTC